MSLVCKTSNERLVDTARFMLHWFTELCAPNGQYIAWYNTGFKQGILPTFWTSNCFCIKLLLHPCTPDELKKWSTRKWKPSLWLHLTTLFFVGCIMYQIIIIIISKDKHKDSEYVHTGLSIPNSMIYLLLCWISLTNKRFLYMCRICTLL